jgi:hypothetical protein
MGLIRFLLLGECFFLANQTVGNPDLHLVLEVSQKVFFGVLSHVGKLEHGGFPQLPLGVGLAREKESHGFGGEL